MGVSYGLVEFLQAAPASQAKEHGREVIVGAARELANFIRRPLRDDFSLQDDAEALAHLLGDFERVCAHEDRDTTLAHAAEHVLDETRAAWIEPHHRLVNGHGARAMKKRGAHDKALLHAVREALDKLVFPSPQLEQV